MQAGDVLLGRFEIEAQVASGAMGIIHRGRDRTSGDFVAVKVLRGGTKTGRLRFHREATVLRVLAHPGIVRYVAHGMTAEGDPAIVMEWLEGEDLAHKLRRGMPIDE